MSDCPHTWGMSLRAPVPSGDPDGEFICDGCKKKLNREDMIALARRVMKVYGGPGYAWSYWTTLHPEDKGLENE